MLRETPPAINDYQIDNPAAAGLPDGNALLFFNDPNPTLPLYDYSHNSFAGESGTACASETGPTATRVSMTPPRRYCRMETS